MDWHRGVSAYSCIRLRLTTFDKCTFLVVTQCHLLHVCAQGCVHSRGACLSCCDAQSVTVRWDVLSQLEHAFSTTGAMPSPSEAEAHASNLPLRSLVAGEITWPGIFGMLQFAGASPGDSFLDCGAGHGRAVAAFATAFGGRSYGVEIRPQLVQTAQQCLERLQQSMAALASPPSHDRYGAVLDREAPPLDASVSLGDMFSRELDWSAYDIVLVNATGFDDALMQRCSQKLTEQLPPSHEHPTRVGRKHKRRGQDILVLSQPLPPPWSAPVARRAFKMSWGQCTVFLYRRRG